MLPDQQWPRPLMGHHAYESVVLLPLKLCVKFELSIIKDCKKYLRKCEITNLLCELITSILWLFGALSGCGQLARPKTWPRPRPFSKFFKCTPGLSLKARMSNMKSVALTVLELLEFNIQKYWGHMTLATLPFRKIFNRLCPDCPCKHARQIWNP